MEDNFVIAVLKESTGASSAKKVSRIQELWSGYGEICRYSLSGSELESVVVKHIQLPDQAKHPRGWDTDFSHQRKLRSYEVEMAWYLKWSGFCSEKCYVPKCLALEAQNEEVVMVLEDLDNLGYTRRPQSVDVKQMCVCLKWLAHFHATFLGKKPDDLWPVGTYWHLDTRPDEWKALKDRDLKDSAEKIDKNLSNATYKTFVHGDAKLANFCFSSDMRTVSVVDFQYVGGGCGMKDVAYFIGSCLYEDDCEKYEVDLLDYYFSVLTNVVKSKHPSIDAKSLEEEWRRLFPWAWTDFHRFIKGWSPGHWKINSYSEKMSKKVLECLNAK